MLIYIDFCPPRQRTVLAISEGKTICRAADVLTSFGIILSPRRTFDDIVTVRLFGDECTWLWWCRGSSKSLELSCCCECVEAGEPTLASRLMVWYLSLPADGMLWSIDFIPILLACMDAGGKRSDIIAALAICRSCNGEAGTRSSDITGDARSLSKLLIAVSKSKGSSTLVFDEIRWPEFWN